MLHTLTQACTLCAFPFPSVCIRTGSLDADTVMHLRRPYARTAVVKRGMRAGTPAHT